MDNIRVETTDGPKTVPEGSDIGVQENGVLLVVSPTNVASATKHTLYSPGYWQSVSYTLHK